MCTANGLTRARVREKARLKRTGNTAGAYRGRTSPTCAQIMFGELDGTFHIQSWELDTFSFSHLLNNMTTWLTDKYTAFKKQCQEESKLENIMIAGSNGEKYGSWENDYNWDDDYYGDYITWNWRQETDKIEGSVYDWYLSNYWLTTEPNNYERTYFTCGPFISKTDLKNILHDYDGNYDDYLYKWGPNKDYSIGEGTACYNIGIGIDGISAGYRRCYPIADISVDTYRLSDDDDLKLDYAGWKHNFRGPVGYAGGLGNLVLYQEPCDASKGMYTSEPSIIARSSDQYYCEKNDWKVVAGLKMEAFTFIIEGHNYLIK